MNFWEAFSYSASCRSERAFPESLFGQSLLKAFNFGDHVFIVKGKVLSDAPAQ